MDIRLRAKMDIGLRYCAYCGKTIYVNEEFWIILTIPDEIAQGLPVIFSYVATLCDECEAKRC